MCMTNKKEVSIEEVSAFKIFTRDKDGLLQSSFIPTFKEGLKYTPNERIHVDVEDATFFAFEKINNAISIARQGRKRWRFVEGGLIVLPVTLYDVVSTGSYFVRSEDSQCLDGYYPAFESKEIVVHDSEENRNQFYDAIIQHWYVLAKFSMSAIDKEALFSRFPHLSSITQ